MLKKCGCSGCYYDIEKEVNDFINDIDECGLSDCAYNKCLQVEMLKNYIKSLKLEIKTLNYKLKEKICFEGHSQFEELKKNSVSKFRLKKKIEDFKKLSAEISGYKYPNIPKDLKRNDYAVRMLEMLLEEEYE